MNDEPSNVHRSSFRVHRSSEAVRRPRSGERERHALRLVAARQFFAQLLQTRFLIAVDEDVDLRKGAAALQARFGNRVAFHSAIGADALGELCLSRLAESGTDVTAVRKFPDKQTGLTVILPGPVKRYILTFPGVMADMRFEDLELDLVFNAQHLHISSLFLQRALRPRVAKLFRLAKQAGLTTSLDTNDDPDGRWDLDNEIFKHLDVLLPNESEACRLAKGATPEASLETLAKQVPLVAMKRGEKGAVAKRGDAEVVSSPFPTQAVDSIGAGDSFDAGFLHQYIRGASLEACLRLTIAPRPAIRR